MNYLPPRNVEIQATVGAPSSVDPHTSLDAHSDEEETSSLGKAAMPEGPPELVVNSGSVAEDLVVGSKA